MAEKTTLATSMAFDGSRTISHLAGHPDIALKSLPHISEHPESWSPPHLFVASVESCLFLTLLAVAKKMRVEITAYSSTAKAILEPTSGRHQEITEIIITPSITPAREQDRPKLTKALELAEEFCYVSRSIRSKLTIAYDPSPVHVCV